MAVTKMKPIKKTLHHAMNYILAEQKTEKGALVTSFHCNVGSLAPDFLDVREASGTKGSVLAHHIIQSFAIGEVSKEKAHEIGVALCDALLKGEYQYVISTHVDKKHVHNHIIFNAVNEKTHRCYRSTPKRYFQEIREKSDALCRKNGLSVIDPYPEKYERHFKKRGLSYFEWMRRQMSDTRPRIARDIDRFAETSPDWETFIEAMKKAGYEVKLGKHVAFHHPKWRSKKFVRARSLGEAYTEEAIRNRLGKENPLNVVVNKRRDKIIDTEKNEKVRSSRGYAKWATKHNLHLAAELLVEARKKGFYSVEAMQAKVDELHASLKSAKTETGNKIDEMKALMRDMEALQALRNDPNAEEDVRHLEERYGSIEGAKTTKQIYETLLKKEKEVKASMMNEKQIQKTLDEIEGIEKNLTVYTGKKRESER